MSFFTDATDAQLLRRAARGDEEAFAALYRRRQGGVYRFALQMCGSADVAEEATQEAFITLASAPESYQETRGSVAAYLYGIARNHVLKRLNQPCASIDDENRTQPVAENASPLEVLVLSEELEAVRKAVLALPAPYREVIVLCDLQELSYAEAAAVLGCPVGTVRSKLSRGRALLGEKLQSAKRCYA